MITAAHFDALRELRRQSQALALACAELTGPAAFIHEAFDRNIVRPTPEERDLLGKIRRIK